MRFQKSQPGAATLVSPSASTGPLKNMDASSPARKAHAHEMHGKAGSISNTCELPWPVRNDMKKRLSTKPVWGRTTYKLPSKRLEPSCSRLSASCQVKSI
jgi:hypothetical protein